MSQFDYYSCLATSSSRGISKAKYAKFLRIVVRVAVRGSNVTILRIVGGVVKALTDITARWTLG